MRKIVFAAFIVILLLCYKPLYSQSSGYLLFVEQGIEKYSNGEYDKAIKLFNAAIADTKASQAEKAKARQWVNKCHDAKQDLAQKKAKAEKDALEFFSMSEDSLNFSSSGGDKTILIDTQNEWNIVSHPSWCEITDNIYNFSIHVNPNIELEGKEGSIVIETIVKPSRKPTYKMIHELFVAQDGREINKMTVSIQVSPSNSRIIIDDLVYGENGQSFVLKEGKHVISIVKPNFLPKDTTIIVEPFDREKIKHFNFSLVPDFAISRFNLIPEEGTVLSIENKPVFSIDNHIINMTDFLENSATKSFDDKSAVEMYKLYSNNEIPIPAGNHIIKVNAIDFEPFCETYYFEKGTVTEMPINLVSKSGTLLINNVSNADSCLVFADKKILGYAPGEFRLTKGVHTISFSKEGYASAQSAILVEIEDGKQFVVDLEMQPFVRYSFRSNPEGAKVFLDGVQRWTTPAIGQIVTCGEHHLKFEKKNYMAVEQKIIVEDDDSLFVTMVPTSSFSINADKADLYIFLKNKNTGEILQPEEKTNSNIEIPYGRYIVELRHINKYALSEDDYRKRVRMLDGADLAYKGRVNFTKTKNSKSILTFSDKAAIVGANYIRGGISIPAFTTNINKESFGISNYTEFGSMDLVKFRFLPGFTTSLLKIYAFQAVDESSSIRWDQKPYLFGASCAFLNGELRMGGALTEHMDCDILGSYCWMPSTDKLGLFSSFGIPYITGTDLFVGVEMATRIKVLNISIKAGEQLFYCGSINIPSKLYSSVLTTELIKNQFPMQKATVISMGITLGSNRGNAMIRLF